MNWYDDLTDGQRADVLAFALGYLKGAAAITPKSTEKEAHRNFAARLLNHLDNAAQEAKKETDDGISIAKTLIKNYCDKQGIVVTNMDNIAPHVQNSFEYIISNAVHDHGKLEEDEE